MSALNQRKETYVVFCGEIKIIISNNKVCLMRLHSRIVRLKMHFTNQGRVKYRTFVLLG